jgi:class 3 adenylate cyclase
MVYHYSLFAICSILTAFLVYFLLKVVLIYKKVDTHFFFSIASIGVLIYILSQLLLVHNSEPNFVILIHKLKIFSTLIILIFAEFTLFGFFQKPLKFTRAVSLFLVLFIPLFFLDIFIDEPVKSYTVTLQFTQFTYYLGTPRTGYYLFVSTELIVLLFTIIFIVKNSKSLLETISLACVILLPIFSIITDTIIINNSINYPLTSEYVLFLIIILFFYLFLLDEKKYRENLLKYSEERIFRAERMHIIENINDSINQSLEISTIFNTILENVILVIPAAQAGTIFIGYEEDNSWRAEAAIGYNIGLIRQISESYSTRLHEFEQNPSVSYLTEHTNLDFEISKMGKERFSLHQKILNGRTLYRTYNIKLVIKGKLLGLLTIDCFDKNLKFSNDDIDFLNTLSSHATTAINNAKRYNEALWKSKRIEFASDIIKTISETFNLNEIFNTILRKTIEIIPAAEACTLFIGNDENDSWKATASIGYDIDLLNDISESFKKHKEQFSRRRLLTEIVEYDYIENEIRLYGEDRYDLHYKIMNGRTLYRSFIIRLIIDNELIGAIAIDCFQKFAQFTHQDEEFIKILSDHATIAIKNARLFNEAYEQKNRLEMANEIIKAISMTFNLNAIFQILLQQAIETVKSAKAGTIYIGDESDNSWRAVASIGYNMETLFEVNESYSERIAKFKSKPFLTEIHTFEQIEQEMKEQGEIRYKQHHKILDGMKLFYSLKVALVSDKQLFGFLILDSFDKKETFKKKDCEYLQMISSHATIAINNARLYEKEIQSKNELLKSKNQEEKLRKIFQRFVPADVITEMVEQDEIEQFMSKNTEAVVMFTDLRNFTSIAESLDPITTVSLLNTYFSEMVEIVIKNGGTIDKFMGDSMLILFQTGNDQVKVANNAIQTGIEMNNKMKEFNKIYQKNGWPKISAGIGIHMGEVILGNIGSPQKMDYTVIGDTVNLASRLESLCKYYYTNFIISEVLYENIENKNIYRELDYIAVKGKTKPTKIYERLPDDSLFLSNEELLKMYYTALKEYRNKEFEKAYKIFQSILETKKDDTPSKLHSKRCLYYLNNPPDKNWQGVFIFNSK